MDEYAGEKKKKIGRQRRNWTGEVNSLLNKYHLESENVKEMTEREWDAHVEKIAKEEDVNNWNRTRETKSKLAVYNAIKEGFGFQSYLNGVFRGGKLLKFKFRSGTSALGEELGRWMKERKQCKACKKKVTETLAHFLYECKGYVSERKAWIKDTRKEFDLEDKKIFNGYLADEKKFINLTLSDKLAGISNDGQAKLNEATEKLLYSMYEKRKEHMFGGRQPKATERSVWSLWSERLRHH